MTTQSEERYTANSQDVARIVEGNCPIRSGLSYSVGGLRFNVHLIPQEETRRARPSYYTIKDDKVEIYVGAHLGDAIKQRLVREETLAVLLTQQMKSADPRTIRVARHAARMAADGLERRVV
ncbi:hypothetical protein J4457_07280 [Candidatus Woesearchaeota archaeon]|nr:hypothetical protein [Candidatus Woesearchaeota archaeon]